MAGDDHEHYYYVEKNDYERDKNSTDHDLRELREKNRELEMRLRDQADAIKSLEHGVANLQKRIYALTNPQDNAEGGEVKRV